MADLEYSTFTVEVPSTTQWDTDRATKFTKQLVLSLPYVLLRIYARADRILWRICVPPKERPSAVNTVYSLYPDATVTDRERDRVNWENSYWYRMKDLTRPFIFPLRYVHEVASLDPLVSVVNAMSDLKNDEQMIYDIEVLPYTRDLNKLGEKVYKEKLTFSLWEQMVGWGILTATTVLSGGRHYPVSLPKTTNQKLDEKRTLEIKESARNKIVLGLREVDFSVFVSSQDEKRRVELFKSVEDALINMYGEFNSLAWTSKESDDNPLILSLEEIATLWHLPNEQMKTRGIVWARTAAPIPPELTQQTKGNNLGTNTFQGRTYQAYLPYESRKSHVNIVGQTGTGKSTLLHNMIHQDIEAGLGVAVIDPHGDLIKKVLACSIPSRREAEVIVFDTREVDCPLGLNPLTVPLGASADKIAEQALDTIRMLFRVENWPEGQMERDLFMALRSLVDDPASTILDIEELFINPGFRNKVLAKVTSPITKRGWHHFLDSVSGADQKKRLEPILSRTNKFYRNERLMRIICHPSPLDFQKILSARKIFLASLGGLDENERVILGSLLVSKFQTAAMSLGEVAEGEQARCYLYIDEVQQFISTSLPEMLSESRKFGISLTTGNQYLGQLAGDTLQALEGNVGASVIFRVGGKDATQLTNLVRDNFTSNDLVNLDNHQAVVKIRAGEKSLSSFPVLTRPPLTKPNNAEEVVKRILEQSRKNYGRSKEEIDAALSARYLSQETEDAGNRDETRNADQDPYSG